MLVVAHARRERIATRHQRAVVALRQCDPETERRQIIVCHWLILASSGSFRKQNFPRAMGVRLSALLNLSPKR